MKINKIVTALLASLFLFVSDVVAEVKSCANDKKFKYKNKSRKNCGWIGKIESRRHYLCNSETEVLNKCPSTCTSCCEDDPNYKFKGKDGTKKPCSFIDDSDKKKKFCNTRTKGQCPVACDNCFIKPPCQERENKIIAQLINSDGSIVDDRGTSTFGRSTAIVGNLLVVGAPMYEMGNGAVYIYEENDSDKSWKIKQKIEAPLEREAFGYSVAMTTDTNTIAVCASMANPQSNSWFLGAVYIFERNAAGVWVQSQNLVGTTEISSFGNRMQFSRDNLLVIYSYSKTLGVGGTLFFFERGSSGSWDFLEFETQTTVSIFGLSNKFLVTFESDSHDLVVKKRTNSGQWLSMQIPEKINEYTNAVALSADTIALAVTNPNPRVHIIKKAGSKWERTQILEAGDENGTFGFNVAFAGDLLVVGAYGDAGAVYVFSRNIAGDWEELEKVLAEDGAVGDQFGLAVSASGRSVAIGAPNSDAYYGAVYVLELHCDN